MRLQIAGNCWESRAATQSAPKIHAIRFAPSNNDTYNSIIVLLILSLLLLLLLLVVVVVVVVVVTIISILVVIMMILLLLMIRTASADQGADPGILTAGAVNIKRIGMVLATLTLN